MTNMTKTIGPESTMQEVLEQYPGAQRALFRRYHIGGCSSCAFSPTETLSQLCQRNNNLNVSEVLAHIESAHELDEKIFIRPSELAELLQRDSSVKLLDVRSREEFDAVHLDGSLFMSQTTMKDVMSQWPRSTPFVIIDHQGKHGLDAAAYFLGHGFENVRCLRGGIDAWSEQIDPKLPRYKLERT
jgi:rhodanese-related sulfurtransferase